MVVPVVSLDSGCSLAYLIQQGVGQVSLLLKQETLTVALPKLSPEEAASVRLAQEAKAYAVRAIGLKETGSYEKVVRLDRGAVTYVVSAAAQDRLEPHLWQFPIVGSVPYKGYFEKKAAEAEQRGLEARGLDTHLRGVAAFSLLGYLPDPLYTSLLAYPPSTLSNIIIHELTHATVFLKGNAEFNEGFATYVGNSGSMEFLQSRYGQESPEVQKARDEVHDERIFADFIRDLTEEMRAYYARADLTSAQKVEGRQALFAGAKERYKALPFKRSDYRSFLDVNINNAYLLLFDTYNRNLGRFDRIRSHFGSLKELVSFFKNHVAHQKDPEAYLDTWEKGR